MRRFLRNISLLACVAFVAVGCELVNMEPTIQGRPYEVVLVCDQAEWQGELGDTLQSVLQAPVKELFTYEPQYDVLRILPENFKDYARIHRNVITVNVAPELEQSGIYVQQDKNIKGQTYIAIQGPNQASIARYVSDNRDLIYQVLEKGERQRHVERAKQYSAVALEELVKKNFGITLHLEQNFTLRSQSDDMVWISKEYTTSSQGFFIYKYPYESAESLSVEALVAARNKFAARIPGPLDGSYMTTVEQIPDETGEKYIPYVPASRAYRLGEQPWIEMCGLWEVEGYFMGGPFVSYTTVNMQTREIITIDCYVYSPKEPKRNLLRELQHLVYQVELPR